MAVMKNLGCLPHQLQNCELEDVTHGGHLVLHALDIPRTVGHLNLVACQPHMQSHSVLVD
eukprot:2328888-Amphidinium_carterae.1